MVLAVLALVGAFGTLAFTTQRATADNVLTFGNVRLRIQETEATAQGEVPVEEGQAVRADQGRISRIVRIENVGANDLFVRVRPVMVAQTADGHVSTGAAVDAHVDYTINIGEGANAWTYNPADGWYYYNSVVTAEGEASTTAELMSALEFTGDYYTLTGSDGSFELTIDAQGVQADNQAAGTTALTAQGWPDSRKQGSRADEDETHHIRSSPTGDPFRDGRTVGRVRWGCGSIVCGMGGGASGAGRVLSEPAGGRGR